MNNRALQAEPSRSLATLRAPTDALMTTDEPGPSSGKAF